MSPSQNRLPGKRVSAGLLQHGKRVLERHNNVQKGQGFLVFVAIQDVAIQSFRKKMLKSMSASALMFFNCCQRAIIRAWRRGERRSGKNAIVGASRREERRCVERLTGKEGEEGGEGGRRGEGVV